MKLNDDDFKLNYEFKKYYEIEDELITGEVMRKLQEKL